MPLHSHFLAALGVLIWRFALGSKSDQGGLHEQLAIGEAWVSQVNSSHTERVHWFGQDLIWYTAAFTQESLRERSSMTLEIT